MITVKLGFITRIRVDTENIFVLKNMKVCTFFGHRDITEDISAILQKTISNLIENSGVELFYVGNQGNFDSIVKGELEKIKSKYTHIKYYVVLAYLPEKNNNEKCDSIYPDRLENTPPKFAITKRNRWMIDNSDYVVTFVKYNVGGAAKFKDIAQKKGKTVINIAKLI